MRSYSVTCEGDARAFPQSWSEKCRRKGRFAMRLPVRSVGWVLPLFLTGCFFHHTHQAPNQQLAPPLAPRRSSTPRPWTCRPRRHHSHRAHAERQGPHRAGPQAPPPSQTGGQEPQEAANTPPDTPSAPPSVSAIGQLSSGDPADYRNETAESINSIERGLNGIDRPLSDPGAEDRRQHPRVPERGARRAGLRDVDGAHTLAVKAKVLLAELTK